MTILNFGSINADIVFAVNHVVKPAETIPAHSMTVNPGGKGANQSVALARAGARVIHAGMVGQDTRWMIDTMRNSGVDTRYVIVSDRVPGGQAVIQVDENGQNSIVIFGGANRQIPRELMDQAFQDATPGDWLVLQNEINLTPELILNGHRHGLRICLNPSPMTPDVREWKLNLVSLFMVNEIEAAQLAELPQDTDPKVVAETLNRQFPKAQVCLTLGEKGAIFAQPEKPLIFQKAVPAKAVDTTAAGDTFTGYLLAALAEGQTPEDAMKLAARAAAVTVSRHGAMEAIPKRNEL